MRIIIVMKIGNVDVISRAMYNQREIGSYH